MSPLETMNKYSPDSACIKCGNKAAKAQHVRGVRGVEAEHIGRRCRNCKFTWKEAPLDSPPPIDAIDAALHRMNQRAAR